MKKATFDKRQDYILKTAAITPNAMPRWMPRAAWLKLPPHLRDCYAPNTGEPKPKYKVIPGFDRVPANLVVSMGEYGPKMRGWLLRMVERGRQ